MHLLHMEVKLAGCQQLQTACHALPQPCIIPVKHAHCTWSHCSMRSELKQAFQGTYSGPCGAWLGQQSVPCSVLCESLHDL